MRYYDLTYLLSPELSLQQAKDFFQKFISFLQKEGGILDKVEEPTKISLAYPIAKKKTSYLASLTFFLGPEKIQNIKKELSSHANILRFLIFSKKSPLPKKVKTEKIKPLLKTPEKKVELKEIEKKLEEILGET